VEKEGEMASANPVANPTWRKQPTKLYTTNLGLTIQVDVAAE
jgi:hypothetical protein